ncbi:hypothetical protein BC830DRAFT_536507 [Chytriomyces sp. MP71]|nr:hypothetical protein BC830DRAFT_536507 [Chytriomyces sp. MP71]
MQWYACKSYLAQLRTPQHALSKWEVEGLRRLADFLGAEVKRLRDTKADAKERRRVRANVPAEIKNVAKMVACFRDLVVREQMKLATGELTQTFVEGFGYGVADGVTEEETDVFDDDEDAENEEGPRGEGGEVGERFPALGGKSIKLKLKLQPNFEEFEEDLKDAGDVVDWKSDESEAENFEDIDDEDDEDFDSGDEELDDDDVDASDIDDLDDQDERNQKRKRDRKNAVAPKTVLSAGVPIASPSSSFPISWTAGPCAAIVSNGSLSVSMPPPHAELSSRAPSAPVQVKNKLAPQPSEATKQMLASIKAAAAAPPPKKKKKSVLASLLKKR